MLMYIADFHYCWRHVLIGNCADDTTVIYLEIDANAVNFRKTHTILFVAKSSIRLHGI